MNNVKLILTREQIYSVIEHKTDWDRKDIRNIDKLMDFIQKNLEDDIEVEKAVYEVICQTAEWYIIHVKKETKNNDSIEDYSYGIDEDDREEEYEEEDEV